MWACDLEEGERQRKHGSSGSSHFIARPTQRRHAFQYEKQGSKQLKECNKKQPRDADAAARCTHRRDLEGKDIKSPEYKNAPVKKISSV